MSRVNAFVIGENMIKIVLTLKQLNEFAKEVSDQLYSKNEYIIQSKVQKQVVQYFLNYFIEKKQILDEELSNINNTYQYYFLIKELGINTNLFSSIKYTEILKKSIIINLVNNTITDKSFAEDFISQHLDFYIDNYPQKLYQLSIQSLYNIFNKNDKINQEKLYRFITAQNNSKPKEIYTLLQIIDCSKLSLEIVKECAEKQDERFGFVPKSYSKTVNNIIDEHYKMKNSIVSPNVCQFHMKNETDEGIFSYLASNSDKFDPGFVASLSSNDIYNMLNNRDGKKDFGFLTHCNYTSKDNPYYTSITFELKDEVLVSFIQVYGIKYTTFAYQINDMEPVSIPYERIKSQTNDVFTIQINPPVNVSKITLIPVDPAPKMTIYPLFRGLELFTTDTNCKGVFQTLLENSRHNDLHRCGVYAHATQYDANYFCHLQNQPKLYLTTHNIFGSWFKVVLTKGFALINGFKLHKIDWNNLINYKIIATDDLCMNENEWMILHEGINEHDTLVVEKFDDFKKIKAIKIIQTGPSSNKGPYHINTLRFYYFDIFGLYLYHF